MCIRDSYRPYHSHDKIELLTPEKVYEVDVEIWPTSIVVPKKYRIGLTIKGQDYVNQSGGGSTLPNMNKFSGCGPFLHDDPIDRPNDIFGKKTTLHFSPTDAILPSQNPQDQNIKNTMFGQAIIKNQLE